MTQLAYKLDTAELQQTVPYPQFRLIEGGKGAKPTIRREIVILGLILGAIQVLDAVLTTMGIGHWGVEAEGNLLLRSLMNIVGHIPALIIAKGLALAVIVALCIFSTRVKWIGLALKCVICVYVFAAIIPWTVLLVGKVFQS